MPEEKFNRRHKNRNDLAGEYKWGDMGQLVLLIVFILVIIVDISFLKISTGLNGLISLWLKIPLGLFFVLLGGILARNGLKIVFGEKRQEPYVIEKGIFGLVRHPIYLGSVLVYLGFLIFTCSIFGLIVWIIIIFFYHFISRHEEKLLYKNLAITIKNT